MALHAPRTMLRLRKPLTKGVATMAIVCAGLFGAVGGATSAVGVLDQSQTNADAGAEAMPTPAFRLAQTFTAGQTGNLDQVDLLIDRNGNPGDLLVEIRTVSGGIPSSTTLAATTVSESTFTPEGSLIWVSVPFDNPAPSSAGTQYAIVISAPGLDCGSICYQWGAALNNPYAGGEALDSVDSGDTWFSPGAGLDRSFNTYVTPALPTSSEQCMHGDWSNFPQFKNQGECASFVVADRRTLPPR
jgi:hypothetical protein